MTPPLLHHDFIQAPDSEPHRWLFLLHGIYGNGRNWNSVSRDLVRERPDWGVVAVDLRGHGDSPALEPPHTLEACVADLDRLARRLDIQPVAIAGHSFGGKVALLFGDEPEHGIRETWVLDSTPEALDPEGSAWGMLRVLKNSPGPFESRDEGVQAVQEHGYPLPVARWMATNLEPTDDGYVWRLDADQMEALLRDFFRTDAWHTVERAHGPRIHFVKGSASDVLHDDAVNRIHLAASNDRVQLHWIRGGHWLNADNPQGVVRLLAEGLGRERG